MQKNKMRMQTTLWFVVSLTLLAMFFIEMFRPFWNDGRIPQHLVYLTGKEENSLYEVFSEFWVQFGSFAVWANCLFVLTLAYNKVLMFKVNPYWKNAIITNMIVTFLLFISLVSPTSTWGLSSWADFTRIYQNILVPAIAIIYFMTTRDRWETNMSKSTLLTLIVPWIFLIAAFVVYFIYSPNIAFYSFFNFENTFDANFNLAFSIFVTSVIIVAFLLAIIIVNSFVAKANHAKRAEAHYRNKKHRIKNRQDVHSEIIDDDL